MIIYYIFTTLISVGIVLTSYFAPDALSFLGNETSQWFANVWINLLWITLFTKPVFMILMQYTELRTTTFWWLWEYLQTIKWRSCKWLWLMVLSIVYFVAGMGMKFRRLLGITIFLSIFTHAGIYIGWWIHIGFGLSNQLQTRNILAGYVGILCLFIGYITSNDFSLRLFKWRWKTIQYVSYIALIFAIFHLLFLNVAEYWGQIIILILYIILKLIEKKKLNSI
jgi:DMSO/TMAO reductase YedYZ heme-binding membrane subunit